MARHMFGAAENETDAQSSWWKGAWAWGRDRTKQYRDKKTAEKNAWGPREFEIRAWQKAMATPPVTSATTWGYGQCAHLIASQSATSPAGAAALAGLSVVGVAFVIRLAGGKKVFLPKWNTLYCAAALVAAAWVAATTWVGFSWIANAILALFTVVLAQPWLREHPEPAAPAPRELEAGALERELESFDDDDADDEKPIKDVQLDAIVDRWYAHIATPNRLQNSSLTNTQPLLHGWRVDVVLDFDRHTFRNVKELEPRIAAVMGDLGMTAGDIIIEPHPTGHEAKAQITFTTKNPLKNGVPYQGPRYNNGYIAIGPWRDGEGWGSVWLSDHNNSVFNGLVTGDPGTGKSVCLENIGMSALASGCWKVFYTDGSEDADSSGLLNKYMTRSEAGLEGAWRQLKAVKSFLAYRGAQNNAIDERGVNPSPERMGLLWIIDELHRLVTADPAFAAELTQVVRLGRKRGVAVWAATQGTDLREDFAGSTALRDILTSRNVIAFYASSKYAHTLISGVTIAPNTLPNDGGYAYLKTKLMSRHSMLRTDYAEDMTPWARHIPEYPWDKGGYLSVKSYLEANQTSQEEKRESAQRRLEAIEIRLQRGLPLDNIDGNETNDAETSAVTAPINKLFTMIPRLGSDGPSEGTGRSTQRELDQELDRIQQAILKLVGEGVTATGDIVARMAAKDVPERTTKRKLHELVEWGRLDRGMKQGVYEIPAA